MITRAYIDKFYAISLGQISFFFSLFFFYFRLLVILNYKDANITKFALLSRLVLIYSDDANIFFLFFKNDKMYVAQSYAGCPREYVEKRIVRRRFITDSCINPQMLVDQIVLHNLQSLSEGCSKRELSLYTIHTIRATLHEEIFLRHLLEKFSALLYRTVVIILLISFKRPI